MSINWNSIPPDRQAQFLEAAGLDQLPAPAALDAAQRKILAGIVGEETAAASSSRADSVARPRLPDPPAVHDWADIMARISELKVKTSDLQLNSSVEQLSYRKDVSLAANRERSEKIQQSLKKLEEMLARRFSPWTWVGVAAATAAGMGVAALLGASAVPLLAAGLGIMGGMALYEKGLLNPVLALLKDNPKIVETIMSALVAAGVLTKEAARFVGEAVIAVAAVLYQLLGGGEDSPDEARTVLQAVGEWARKLAEAFTGAPRAPTATDRELGLWLAKLQAKLAEQSKELEDFIANLNAGVAAIPGRLGATATVRRDISFHHGA